MKHEKLSLSPGLRGKRILAVLLLILYLAGCQLLLSARLIDHAEEQCIQRLREATIEFSTNYYEHAMSDREQLGVVADMLSVLMDEGVHDLHTHLASFEQRGMLDWLQVLLPDGTLLTGSGTYNLSHQMDYQAEVSRLPYISNVSQGLVDPSKRVIRSAVPITENGKTIAVLYGVYDLTAGHMLDGVTAYNGSSYTFILEADTGSYILDGLRGHDTIGTTGSTYQPKPGYDLTRMQNDLASGREGYSAFASLSKHEYMYIYYAPIGINSWMVMVSVPESAAMAFAFDSRTLLLGALGFITLGVIVYFIYIHRLDHKLNEKTQFISRIQSQLMEVYRKPDHFNSALQAVAERAQSDMLFLVDAHLPQTSAFIGSNEQFLSDCQSCAAEFTSELFALSRSQGKQLLLRRNSHLLHGSPLLTKLMKQYQQSSLALVPILTPNKEVHQVMGVFTPRNGNALLLLDVLAPDFFIAANNIDFLTRLNHVSTIDTLTGAMNRTSYHLRLEMLCTASPCNFGCAYVDVNDLHAMNNRFGHDAGDAMLRTIATALMDAFENGNVYRFGGDEFIILAEGITEQQLNESLAEADSAITAAGYTVSIGSAWASQPPNVDDMIRTAESRMYQAKYLYYQQKEKRHARRQVREQSLQRLLTGQPDVDAFLHVAGDHYRGVYVVNLATDTVREIIAHHFFHMALQENEQKFSKAFQHYIAESVDKQSRRSVQNFFSYPLISGQLSAGETPIVEYTKIDGERVRLTVYRLPGYTESNPESLWIIELTA